MSMSTSIVGFRPPDEKWRKMKKVWDSCSTAGIEPPEEVSKFFEWEPPDDAGVEINLEGTSAVREYNAESRYGYEVVIAELRDYTLIVEDVTELSSFDNQ